MSKKKEINLQNFPARENSEIRNIITAPEDYFIVAYDYGQLEARIIAMASKDKVFCDAIWDGSKDSDTHYRWTDRIIDEYPQILEKIDRDSLRTDTKTALVFAAFYGSTEGPIAKHYRKLYGVPEEVMKGLYREFWDTYPGVKKWQQSIIEFYKKNGYVESFSGRRRRAPLSINKITNHPIQSTASYDICLKAGDRLSKLAYELDKPQYQYVINIHDDLTFYIPKDSFQEDVEFIAKEMVRPVYDWIIVPLEVEIKFGTNWGSLEKLGKMDTKYFYKEFKKGEL